MKTNKKINIKEIIVVEGKNDIRAVKNAVNAQVISTSGLGLNKKIEEIIKKASEKNDIIILTDSDFAGEKIRKKIEKLVQGRCKHAFVSREDSTKEEDIGIENASEDAIINALEKAHFLVKKDKDLFTMQDMIKYGFTGCDYASDLREFVGRKLGIGYANCKQFLSRLNHFGITRQEVENAIQKYREKI